MSQQQLQAEQIEQPIAAESKAVEREEEKEVSEEVEKKEPEKKKRKIRVRGPKKIPDIYFEKLKDYTEERFLTLRFSPKVLKRAPKWKRARKVAKLVREYVVKYVKYTTAPQEQTEGQRRLRILEPYVWISPEVNEIIWANGAKNPPTKLRVRVLIKVDEIVKDEEEKPIGCKAELRVFPLESKKIKV